MHRLLTAVVSLVEAQTLDTWVRTSASWARECRLSSCDAQAELLCGMWDPPGPGIEPVSAALAGGFFTTEPQRKPPASVLKNEQR